MALTEAAEESGGEGYFASVSDMMVGILFIFLLLLTVFALNFREAEQEQKVKYAEFLAAQMRATEAERFAEPRSRGELARGLLRAWLERENEPDESIRFQVQDFLLEHLDDPRLKPQRWQEAGEPAANLMRRWLTRASLKAFFGLISEHALDSHWRYREAFWSACIEKNAAVEAWLALGSRIYASARSVEDLKGAYARLEGAGGDQAVLLLRVKNIVFCEWSHSGALRAWPADWPTAPLLGRRSYAKTNLMADSLPFPPKPKYGSRGAPDGRSLHHHGSDQSRWQGSAAELLERRAQIVLSPTDWMPR